MHAVAKETIGKASLGRRGESGFVAATIAALVK
jgi:hypothetical protein